ncbi:MAG: hypothetical protein JNJ57_20500 [Saprospiraceae bacterium]|nr:hypothetical protein [Saprospiraceae bacterium]
MRQFPLIILLFAFIQIHPVFSQSLRSYERAGDVAFEKKDYGAAFQYYSDVLKRKEDDLSLWWKYGECARLFNAFPEAEQSYKRVSSSQKHKKKHPLVDYRIAEVKKGLGDYSAAANYFEKFLTEQPKADPTYYEKARMEIIHCRAAQEISAAPPTIEIKALGKEINSPWYEFAPSIVGDTLFYSSNRFDKKSDKGNQKRKLSKVMIASKSGRGREPGRGFPTTDTAHIAHTAFSPDGHYVFFTMCKDINSNDKRCELWLTVIDRRRRWLPPVKLPAPINIPGYTSTQPNIGFDNDAQGPVLWFASDRPGGKGKLDLWKVPLDTNFFCECNLPLPGKKINYLPDFEQPENLSTINTTENDATPFYYAPEQKLYFSSEGLPGLGGYDIFYADKDNGQFREPVNAGTGYNTSYNDLYLVLNKTGESGYLSSNRTGSLYLDEKNKVCCNDLFSFKKLPQKAPETPKPSDSTQVVNIVPKTPETVAVPEVKPIEPPTPLIEDFAGLPLYFDNDEPDKRTRKTNTLQTYDETVRNYLARQREYRDRFAAGLKDVQADEAEKKLDEFFENEVRLGADRLNALCDLLLTQLQNNSKLEVQIKGFTSPRAEPDYNQNLAKRRISSVRNHFESFADGALKPYMTSGQLKVVELSFGETTAKAKVSDALSDERNSIYNPDAARERRVEIVKVLHKE